MGRSPLLTDCTKLAAVLALLCIGLLALTPPKARAAVTAADFGYMSMAPRTNLQPLLVVLVRFDDTNSGPTVAETANWIFPDSPTNRTVNGFFAEMSANQFAFTNVGVIPILESAANKYDAMKARLGETKFNDGIYLSNLYARAVQSNRAAFDRWDTNPRDNMLSQSELFILFVLKDSLGGASRPMHTFLLPFGPGWKAGNVFVSPPADIETISHELSHALGAVDLYGIWGSAEQDMHKRLSLMASGLSHLDAWHKMRLGWYEPRIFSLRSDGTTTLRAAQRRHPLSPIILYDEIRGTDEYYLLEYRTRACEEVPNTYFVHDNVPGSGLLIWHVMQNPNHDLPQYAEVVYPQADRHWWQCKHCRILYLEVEGARPCASTNGVHARHGNSSVHFLIKDVPADPGEHGWRQCVKCRGLCYQPLNAGSACAAGGQHSPQSSGDYSLAKNVIGPVGHNNWARCLKCQTLFLTPEWQSSVCAKDLGLHQAAADRYTLIAGWAHRMLMSRSHPDLLLGENRLWPGGSTTPHLTWYDGTTNLLRIGVDPFNADANFIRVRWTSWDPIPLVVSHPAALPEGYNTFTVSVTDGTNAVAGATVTIQQSQGGEWEKTTAANGTAVFSLSLLGPTTLQVAVTKDRCIPYTGTIAMGTGYLAFDPVASSQLHGVPFPITLRARSAAGVVSNFTGAATLEAFRRGPPPSVLLTVFILGRSGSYYRGLQVQNVSTQAINTAGWRVVLGDNRTNINAINPVVKSLPATMASQAFLGWADGGFATPWGAVIGWRQDRPGWALILNSSNQVVDFAAWGWDSQAIQTMAPVVSSQTVQVGDAWVGDGFPVPTGNQDIGRRGSEDVDAADDFQTSLFNETTANSLLTLPFVPAELPVSMEPEVTGAFSNGLWSGAVALLDVASNVVLRAVAGPRQGLSGALDVKPAILDHYTFAPISSPKTWNAPFPITLTAQDASSNTVIAFNGQTRLYGFQSIPRPPIVITECSLSEPDIVEVQNVSSSTYNTTGWRVIAGDDPKDINRVNPQALGLRKSLAAGQVYWAKDDPHSTNYWGGALNWSNDAPGWVMLLDDQTNVVDFVVWGWSEEDIAGMSPHYGEVRLSVSSQWVGPSVPLTQHKLPRSLQRQGEVDYNRSQDFVWNFTSYGYPNKLLITPLAGAFGPIAIQPSATSNFTNGIWAGNVTVLDDATNLFLQAIDSAGRHGESTAFEARYLGQLTVTLPATVTEGDGVLTGQGIIRLPGGLRGGITVHLTSSDTTEVTVPKSISVLSHQSSVAFNLTVLDDALYDLGREVTIEASAAGCSNGMATMVVLDNEQITAALKIPGALAEGNGIRTNAAQISLSHRVDKPVVFSLASSDTSEIQLSPSVTVPAGSSGVYFDLNIIDDTMPDGAQTVTISAAAPGMSPLTDVTSVADNDPHHFEFSPIEAEQTVLQPFAVTLRAVNASGVILPAFNGYADLLAQASDGLRPMQPAVAGPFTNGVWNGLVSLSQIASDLQLLATGAGVTGTSAVFAVRSGSFHHFAWDSLPAAAHMGAWLSVRITACDSNGFPVSDFTGPVQLSCTRQAAGTPVRLLTFTRYADVVSHSNTLIALSDHFADFVETPIATLDSPELGTALSLSDVFLIPAQNEAGPLTLETLGTSWAAELGAFVTNGGVLIVCSGLNDEHRLLASAGLLNLDRFSYGSETVSLMRWMSSPLTAGVDPFFTAWNVGAFDQSPASMHIATLGESAAVVVAHPCGDGAVVALAYDFSTLGSQLDRVLANAVRLGTKRVPEPVPVTPAAAVTFVNGVWTGVLSAGEAGLGLQFAASDGAGRTDHSGLFDAGPLLLGPVVRSVTGELTLRWNSDGVTRYSIEGSDSLEPGSFAPIVADLPATPPCNTHILPAPQLDHAFYRIRVAAP